MKLLIFISCILLPVIAQGQEFHDSLYIQQIDAIRHYSDKIYTVVKYKRLEDSTTQTSVTGLYDNGHLIGISCAPVRGWCESVIFRIRNDSLVCVDNILTDYPASAESGMPRTTHVFYFKDNKQVHYVVFTEHGGAAACKQYLLDKKDILKQFYYYKDFVQNQPVK